jgi:hypothetical protein
LYCYAAIATCPTIFIRSISTVTAARATAIYDKATVTCVATIAISCYISISTVTAARATATYNSTTGATIATCGGETEREAHGSISTIPSIRCTARS